MPLLRFVVLTAIGSGVWNAAVHRARLGARGELERRCEGWLGPVSYVVLGLLVVGLVVLAVRKLRAPSTAT